MIRLLTFGLLLSLVSCYKPVKGVKIEADTQGDNIELSLSSTFDFKGVMLPSLTDVPIRNPENYVEVYGYVDIRPYWNGAESLTEISVELNLTEILKLTYGDGKLPNGDKLPLANFDEMGVKEVAIDNLKAEVYVAANGKVNLIGFAIVSPVLDSVAKQVMGVNFFPEYRFNYGEKTFRAIGGLFTGNGDGTSGVALFADFTPAVQDLNAQKSNGQDFDADNAVTEKVFKEVMPEKKTLNKFYWELEKLRKSLIRDGYDDEIFWWQTK